MSELARLRWQCRRGALELDLLLTRYLDTYYSQAGEVEQALFKKLLSSEDDDLLSLLLLGTPLAESEAALRTLVHKIRYP